MKRIDWLDSSRGTAILCLIFIHYVGALESRDFISYDFMNIIKSIFRVATPYFIIIFGFTFSIAYSNKLVTWRALSKLYSKLTYRLVLVIIAREVIVLVSAIRYPEMKDQLLSILLYQEFSASGEILTFYFFAILFSPIALFFMRKNNNMNIVFILCLYSFGYVIGSTYNTQFTGMWFRFLFYDVYALFPFFSLVMLGMYFGILYKSISNDSERLIIFSLIFLVFLISGLIILQFLTNTPVLTLANATLKAPPHIAYLLIYSALAIFISGILAIVSTKKILLKTLFSFLDIIGRNSLLSYVLHYFLFMATPISIFVFGNKNATNEFFTFIFLMFTLFGFIYARDYIKINKKQRFVINVNVSQLKQ
ncbi:MAG: surface polysaccharide O-acyltransferase-like enzyme [Moritella sp.]|jgi:surface polysaccharide O-acyltransferase-like enzyme